MPDDEVVHVFDQTNGVIAAAQGGGGAPSDQGAHDVRRTGQNLAGASFLGQ